MGSYEEWVVDKSVDAAWLEFRVRLADHLAGLAARDMFDLRIDMGAGFAAVVARFWATTDGEVGAAMLFETPDGLRERPAPGLRKCGFRCGSRVVERSEVDALVLGVEQWFRYARAVPHPSFVEVLSGGLVLVDPPEQLVTPAAAPAMPESVAPTSPDDLVVWVDRVLTERLGREPSKRKDGSVGLSRDGDKVDIRVSSTRPIIEVWAVVARDVDVRKARRMLPKLNGSFYFFSFSLAGDRLLVSSSVNASPFCPDHLNRALDSTFAYLDDHGAKVRRKLARTVVKEPPAEPAPFAATDNTVDADLLLVYGVASDHKATVQLVRDLTGDSRTSLGQWREAASQAGRLAREKASEVENGPVQNALIEQYITWRHVASAITEAVEDIVGEQASA